MTIAVSAPQRSPSFRPVSISEGLRTSAQRTPSKLAYTSEYRDVTHAQLIDRVNRGVESGRGPRTLGGRSRRADVP